MTCLVLNQLTDFDDSWHEHRYYLRSHHLSNINRTNLVVGATRAPFNKIWCGNILSTGEHQGIREEDAAVMPVGGPRKWRRFCNLTPS
jgi:hypothetical protein